MCSCSQRTECGAARATGSAVCGSASSSAAVLSVHGSPDEPEHGTAQHKPQHLPAKFAALRLAPTHSAAPVKRPAEEITQVRNMTKLVTD